MKDQIEELEEKLQDLYKGRLVIVPNDLDHAYQMLMIASSYIRDDKHRMWSTLREMKNERTN